jgi:hypothetical protein
VTRAMSNSANAATERTDVWLTPPGIIDALGGYLSFDLDPCAPVYQPWPTAKRTYTEEDNGILMPWDGRVWLNPPYSTKPLAGFMERMALHDFGVALIFAKTETEMFHRHVWARASALLFLRGRINFHRADGARSNKNAGAPSVLVAYGYDDADLLAAGVLDGAFVPLRIPRHWLLDLSMPTWREVVAEIMTRLDGPVRLDDLYRCLSAHPKAKTNPNYQAKIRQTLQKGNFGRVGRGLWQAEVSA